ncbi:hypothetical protein RCL_jg23112.t1 [Rhizophagus clarus]|uniref:Uncharacterized protein n=1 Tax=Rhizophagus clarus TaxID=94130 RepID=A0A8H3L7B1_9GLOM|nr:hypothetical protein RCL_jg23112.t1 [Rhizophagus clarus]
MHQIMTLNSIAWYIYYGRPAIRERFELVSYGYNFISETNDPLDGYIGHGTHSDREVSMMGCKDTIDVKNTAFAHDR